MNNQKKVVFFTSLLALSISLPYKTFAKTPSKSDSSAKSLSLVKKHITNLVKLAKDNSLASINPITLDSSLKPLVELKQKLPEVKDYFEMQGEGKKPFVRWVRATFGKNDQGSHDFIVLGIMLTPTNTSYDKLYKEIVSTVEKQLGKPSLKMQDPKKVTSFKLEQNQIISVEEGPIGNPFNRQVERTISFWISYPDKKSQRAVYPSSEN